MNIVWDEVLNRNFCPCVSLLFNTQDLCSKGSTTHRFCQISIHQKIVLVLCSLYT